MKRFLMTAVVACVAGLSCSVSMGDVLLKVDHNDFNDSGTAAYSFTSNSVTWVNGSGSAQVVTRGGEKWIDNKKTSNDMGRHGFGAFTDPIAINGATVMAAIERKAWDGVNPNGEPWNAIVDIFYDQLTLGVSNQTGRVKVKVSGANGGNPTWTSAVSAVIPENTPGILSLTVGSEANPGFEVFWRAADDLVATSMGTGNGNTGGVAYTTLNPGANGRNFARFINLGRNNPDGWPVFDGFIGDVTVWDEQLTGSALLAAETAMMQNMGMAAAIPEPASGVTLLIGAAGLLLKRRRRA